MSLADRMLDLLSPETRAAVLAEVERRPLVRFHVTRERNFPLPAHPGMAWTWLYTVTGPGCAEGGNKGAGLSWVKSFCRRTAGGGVYEIDFAWKR